MLGCLNDMQIHVFNVLKMIWNVYFSFQQTQNEFKKFKLFFRNFNRKYNEIFFWQMFLVKSELFKTI